MQLCEYESVSEIAAFKNAERDLYLAIDSLISLAPA
jgi:hypothetical protein